MKLLDCLRLIPRILKLLLRVGWGILGVGLAKRKALRAYERTLKREGLPETFISELVLNYDLRFGELLRRGLSRFRARG